MRPNELVRTLAIITKTINAWNKRIVYLVRKGYPPTSSQILSSCVYISGVSQRESMNQLKDGRVDCFSVITNMPVEEYLSFVDKAYRNKGGIDGQRDALKTSTGIRIRKRMVEDFHKGAVLPPIVIGILVNREKFQSLNNSEITYENIKDVAPENISIIDGMQRTTAIMDAVKTYTEVSSQNDIKLRSIRIEFWIAHNTNSLLYRMLVLNTGQVPWNLKRQISVIFNSMISEIGERCTSVELLEDALGKNKKRWRGGQFQPETAVEMYLGFGSRRENIDTKEKLTDEFTRLDFIEATSEEEFTSNFYEFFDLLAQLDKKLSSYQAVRTEVEDSENKERFAKGRDLFSSQPACVGFTAAIAQKIYGRPGMDKSFEEVTLNTILIKKQLRDLVDRLSDITEAEIGDYLDFPTLNQVLSSRSAKSSVGTIERTFFFRAFAILIDEKFILRSLTPCWRA